jgi:hypothetical protein
VLRPAVIWVFESPMQFVDWRSINAAFCGLMWLIVLVLAVVILVHRLPATPAIHHVTRAVLR